ncbi:MMPL family transporter [Actinoplanes sp. NPDC051513]|uniref:MMPL family transporter n=1 Tax=Actinoplanes sp. NPDC051513 TaxID=3363908 RepID=UPI00379E4096
MVRHPVWIIVGWVLVISALTGVSVLAQFQHWQTSTSAQTAFLPDRYESTPAQAIADRAFPRPPGVSAQLVVTRVDGGPLTPPDIERAVAIADDARRQAPAKLPNNLKNPLVGVQVDPGTRSPNGKVMIGQAAFDQPTASPEVVASTKLLRAHVRDAVRGTGLRISLTGDAAAVVDTERESCWSRSGCWW